MDFKIVAEGLAFPEGPVWMEDGSIILVEIAKGCISRVWGDGKTEVIATPGGGPNGAAIGPDGALWVCNNGGFIFHEREGLVIPGHCPDDYSGGRIERVGDLTRPAVGRGGRFESHGRDALVDRDEDRVHIDHLGGRTGRERRQQSNRREFFCRVHIAITREDPKTFK